MITIVGIAVTTVAVMVVLMLLQATNIESVTDEQTLYIATDEQEQKELDL